MTEPSGSLEPNRSDTMCRLLASLGQFRNVPRTLWRLTQPPSHRPPALPSSILGRRHQTANVGPSYQSTLLCWHRIDSRHAALGMIRPPQGSPQKTQTKLQTPALASFL